MNKEEHLAASLDGPVQRGFFKTKPGSTFGSHWDPEKVHKVPGYRDPVVYQSKMKEHQAALKSQGKAHVPNRHAIQKAAVKQETARTARKRRSRKVKVNRTRPIFAEGQANHVDRRGFPAKKEAFEDRESSENSGLELMDNFQEQHTGIFGRRRRRSRRRRRRLISQAVAAVTKPVQQVAAPVVKVVTDNVPEVVKTAIDNTVKVLGVVDTFLNNAAAWTEAQAKSAVKFVAGAVKAIEDLTEEFVDAVQEAAENVGNFFVGAFKAGKEWFLGFLEEILTKLVEGGEGFTDVTSNLASNAAVPGGITDGSPIESIFSDIGSLLTNTVLTPLGQDMKATGEKIVSAVAAFFGDEDLFSGIFGQIGASAITGLENVITGKSALNAQTALNELNKIKKICVSYLKKYFMPLLSSIQWLANQIANRVTAAIDEINGILGRFISDISATKGLGNGLTWYIGICGELYIGPIFVGTCTLFPFTINGGSDTLSLQSVTQEFGIGMSVPLVETEPSAGKLAGIRIGYIVTDDQTAVQGSAVGRGIEVSIETTSTYPDISVGLGFTQGADPPQPLLSLDLGLMGSYNTPDIPAPGSLEFEYFTGYAYGWAPFAALADAIQPGPFQDGYVNQQPTAQNVLLAQHVGRTNGLFQKSAVTGNIREYVLQHFHNLNEDRQNIHHLHLAGNHFYNVTDFTAQYSDLEERNFAKLQRSNVDDLVRVSGSAVDGNTRIKYGVFQKALCLPGAAIYSLAECQEAKRILVNTGTIPPSSTAIPVGGWEGVPTGCSVQNGVNVHFGTYPVTNNARLLSGEFATVCRRLFKIGPERQKECPSGSGITTSKMCKDAFYELQGKFSLPPNEGFPQGGGADLPWGCSVRVGLPTLGNSPWFKPYGADFGFQNTGMFQGICKATRYWLERAGMRSCPVGSHITTLAECAEAYKQLKDMFRYPSLRGVVANENPGWEGVPRGCSIQIGSLGADNSPHFNGNKYSKGQRGLLGTGTGDFATQAEFQSICKEPSFWRPEVGGQECPAGTQISGQLACKAAYESLRDTFSAIAKRLLQSGSWSGVPRGCSAPFAGSDSTPHVNSYTGVPSGTGDWSSMCWPGRYYIPPRGATRCPTNQQVTSRSECRQALLALLPVLQAAAGRESIVPGRGVVVADGSNGLGSNGNIPPTLGVPRWCSYQAGGDYSAHFNCAEPNPGDVVVDNYRPICKILVPNVDLPPDGSCGWRVDD